jgi:hypothetical protein
MAGFVLADSSKNLKGGKSPVGLAFWAAKERPWKCPERDRRVFPALAGNFTERNRERNGAS